MKYKEYLNKNFEKILFYGSLLLLMAGVFFSTNLLKEEASPTQLLPITEESFYFDPWTLAEIQSRSMTSYEPKDKGAFAFSMDIVHQQEDETRTTRIARPDRPDRPPRGEQQNTTRATPDSSNVNQSPPPPPPPQVLRYGGIMVTTSGAERAYMEDITNGIPNFLAVGEVFAGVYVESFNDDQIVIVNMQDNKTMTIAKGEKATFRR